MSDFCYSPHRRGYRRGGLDFVKDASVITYELRNLVLPRLKGWQPTCATIIPTAMFQLRREQSASEDYMQTEIALQPA
jgi:hypothetical protein